MADRRETARITVQLEERRAVFFLPIIGVSVETDEVRYTFGPEGLTRYLPKGEIKRVYMEVAEIEGDRPRLHIQCAELGRTTNYELEVLALDVGYPYPTYEEAIKTRLVLKSMAEGRTKE